MSTYYDFYVGEKDRKSGEIDIVGPYKKENEKFVLKFVLDPIISRSRSFIEWDGFEAFLIPVDKMSEELKRVGSVSFEDGTEPYSLTYWIDAAHVRAQKSAIIRGWIKRKDAVVLAQSKYDLDFIHGQLQTPLSDEAYNFLSDEDKDEYTYVCYEDVLSADYIKARLNEFVDFDVYEDNDKEYGIIVIVS